MAKGEVMRLTGNTILITGGGSGIGRGLAEALHALGNQVIISGRRKAFLDEVTKANPGMASIELDVEDPTSITSVAAKLIADYPKLNVLLNNAGAMKMDDAGGVMDDATMVSIITTNLMGSIRLTSALIEHLKTQASAAVIYMTSGLAFTPLAMSAVYNSTKAALHSYALSQRYKLKGTSVKVLEIAPPYVQTELMGSAQASDPRAMPLKDFIDETMKELGTDKDEVLTERVKMLRNNVGPNEWDFVVKFNDMMEAAGHHAGAE
jgi:uncharacterized oxidoreductase